MLLPAVLLLGGCPSFDTSVRPLIDVQPPPGYVPPVYVKGTKDIAAVDLTGLTMQVWRINSDPYPDSVQIFARVFDRGANLVGGLAPPYYKGSGDYRAIWSSLSEQLGAGGATQEIKAFTVREFSDQDAIPYEIALALDYSGTMGTTINALEEGALAFIRIKRPQDRIAIVKFDDEPQIALASTSSTADLSGAFKKTGLEGYGGYTALYSAAKLAAEQVASAPADHPRAVVLFTDGEDNASTITPTSLYEFARRNNIPIFTIAYGAINTDVLTEIATSTGGRFYHAYSPEELRSVFEDIYSSLRNYYLISYKPPYVAGRHLVTIGITPPGAPAKIAGTGTYDAVRGAGRPEGDGDLATIALDTSYFEYNKYEITPSALKAVDRMAAQMRENPRLKIEVRGHTDAVGTEEYNMKLSQARADAIRQALIDAGIEESRVRARGFGMMQPVASNVTEEGRKLNRRTTFVVIAR